MAKQKLIAQNPLILRCHRLIEAFSKSDDERDFYLDRQEGFILFVDLDKAMNEVDALKQDIEKNSERYHIIPKLTFYETKKIMEGFVNEKVYDIDTKEKLLDIIQSKEARENFLEFIYDHHTELEKWQQYYQERSRIRIIEWLRQNQFHFVFEEDLELPRSVIDKLKKSLFQPKVPKDILTARKALVSKAKTYYSNEALNPRPKRGRPPKQAVKLEIEPKVTTDIYTTVSASATPFLFIPDISSPSAITFSSKFESEAELMASKRQHAFSEAESAAAGLSNLKNKLAAIRNLSSKWVETDAGPELAQEISSFDDDEDDEDEDDEEFGSKKSKKESKGTSKVGLKGEMKGGLKKLRPIKKSVVNNTAAKSPSKNNTKVASKNAKSTSSKPVKKKIMPQAKPGKVKPKAMIKAKPNTGKAPAAKAKAVKRPLKKIITKKPPARKKP